MCRRQFNASFGARRTEEEDEAAKGVWKALIHFHRRLNKVELIFDKEVDYDERRGRSHFRGCRVDALTNQRERHQMKHLFSRASRCE